jgi:ESCRT-II complex subunit VPS25
MVIKNVAAYEPPKQTRSVLLYWRLPEEWAEVLHGWVCSSLEYMITPHVLTEHHILALCTGDIYRATEHHPDILRNH